MREHLYPTDYHIINVEGGKFLDDAIVDFDDFQPSADGIFYMDKLKEMYPDFKVTMFAIPGRLLTNRDSLNKWETRKEWIQLAVHGWSHCDNFEATRWNKADTIWYMKATDEVFPGVFQHGFKAPGWQIGDECYKGLLELDYWVADQRYNDERRPEGLKCYSTGHPWIVHGHTWDMGYHPFNGVGQIMKENRFPFKVDTKFHFISEVIEKGIDGLTG